MKETAANVRTDTMVRRYHELKRLIHAAELEAAALNDALKDHIRETGEVLEVEGLPPLKLHVEGSGWSWDTEAMQADEVLWQRIKTTRGLLTIDTKILKAVEDAGMITGVRKYGFQGQREVLRFERK